MPHLLFLQRRDHIKPFCIIKHISIWGLRNGLNQLIVSKVWIGGCNYSRVRNNLAVNILVTAFLNVSLCFGIHLLLRKSLESCEKNIKSGRRQNNFSVHSRTFTISNAVCKDFIFRLLFIIHLSFKTLFWRSENTPTMEAMVV